MNNYEEKKQARIDRLKQAADRAEQRANSEFNSAHKMAEAIPFGQPILVGHHSEQRDRNYRNRIDKKFEKAISEQERASELRAKAEAAENNTAISSDDPEAITKLEKKLESLQKSQEVMKAVNRYYKQHGTCVGCDEIDEDTARELDIEAKKEYNFSGKPFPSWALSNNLNTIHTVKERIEQLKRRDELDFEPIEFDGGVVVANKEINRIQIFFDDIPDEDVRAEMKSRGFKFSRYNDNAWQRQLNSNGIYAAKKVVEKIEELSQTQTQDQGPVLGM